MHRTSYLLATTTSVQTLNYLSPLSPVMETIILLLIHLLLTHRHSRRINFNQVFTHYVVWIYFLIYFIGWATIIGSSEIDINGINGRLLKNKKIYRPTNASGQQLFLSNIYLFGRNQKKGPLKTIDNDKSGTSVSAAMTNRRSEFPNCLQLWDCGEQFEFISELLY